MSAAAVHPLQPRFAQAITAVICLEALIFQAWPAVTIALVLVAVALVAPAWSPVNWLFRQISRAPASLEPAAPVRFSQLLAVVCLGLATLAFLLGADLVGWVITGAVAVLAGLAAVAGICVGCEIYRLALARRGRAGDLREALGLSGDGPWLVVLTAPGCARCGPVADRVEAEAGAQRVVRVDLARRPKAAALPVRSVPAVVAVGRDGRVAAARAGALGPDDISLVLAAV